MITIASATPHHAPGIHEIELASFSEPWSASAIEYEITQPHSICFVALDENDALVGYASMRHIINEGHISNIAVAPAYRRGGIGAMLLNALMCKAIYDEMIGVTLEVRVSNQAAIALYEKHGFITEGYRKNYYSSPTEDAAIMWKYL